MCHILWHNNLVKYLVLKLACHNGWHIITCEKFDFMARESQLGDSLKVVKILDFKAGVSQWVTR